MSVEIDQRGLRHVGQHPRDLLQGVSEHQFDGRRLLEAASRRLEEMRLDLDGDDPPGVRQEVFDGPAQKRP